MARLFSSLELFQLYKWDNYLVWYLIRLGTLACGANTKGLSPELQGDQDTMMDLAELSASFV